jgi:DUF4097 and DUF4098 domain-containing protein YvlB
VTGYVFKRCSVKNLTIGLMLLNAAGAAHAGEAVDKTLAVKPDGVVRIENVRGRIDVQGWDRNDVSVTGTLDDATRKFTFETSSATTTVKVETGGHMNRGEGSDLVIHVPVASRVQVDLVSADLSLKGLHGAVDGKTVSGDIDATDLGGRVEIGSVSGDIALAGSDGPLTLRSVSGDIKATTHANEITLVTVSGDADLTSDGRLDEATLHSVSGTVEISAELADGARVRGASTSGDMRFRVNPDVNAVVKLSATSGRIKNALSADRAQRSVSGSEDLEFTLGSGSGSIELTTVSGKLELLAR